MSQKKHLEFFMNLIKDTKHAYSYNTLLFDYGPILNKLNLPATYHIPRKTEIIDLYPTIGAFSLALNETIKPSKHLFMEPHLAFQAALKSMMQYHPDPSWVLSEKDPFFWESFSDLVGGQDKVLNPKHYNKDILHPEFLLTANAAYPRGEVLLLQWMQCILNQNWAQQFGNVRMLVWCYQQTAAKFIPAPGEKYRAKFALVAELASDIEVVATTAPKKYMFSERYLEDNDPLIIEPLLVGRAFKADDLCLLDIRPKKAPIDNFDEWDYVTKQLFIFSASPLSVLIGNLGPGASDWFQDKLHPDLWEKTPVQMTQNEFIEVTNAFMRWPFKPDIYEILLMPADD